MSETIVVLIDIAHPDSAKALLEKANKRYEGADLHITYVMPYGFFSYVEPFVSEESQADAASRAKEAVEYLVTQVGCVSATRHVLRGGIGDQALAFAKSIKADVIVLNAIRKGSMLGTLGTHAAQIVRHSECDVHIVR